MARNIVTRCYKHNLTSLGDGKYKCLICNKLFADLEKVTFFEKERNELKKNNTILKNSLRLLNVDVDIILKDKEV